MPGRKKVPGVSIPRALGLFSVDFLPGSASVPSGFSGSKMVMQG